LPQLAKPTNIVPKIEHTWNFFEGRMLDCTGVKPRLFEYGDQEVKINAPGRNSLIHEATGKVAKVLRVSIPTVNEKAREHRAMTAVGDFHATSVREGIEDSY
jgi:hypothetical protein